MANPEHLDLLRQGVNAWNEWRAKGPSVIPDLQKADLHRANLSYADLANANLSEADLSEADLYGTDLRRAGLSHANLFKAELWNANLSAAGLFQADLREANLNQAGLFQADLREANLNQADLRWADLCRADLSRADLSWAHLSEADLSEADLKDANLLDAKLSGANLSDAHLSGANLRSADLSGANLSGANLSWALLVDTNLVDATLIDCSVYGVSAWGVKLNEGTKQHGLIIANLDEPAITVDDLEVAQFVYLLLHNEKIRHVIDTVGKKGVLLLGRFTEGRIEVLERLREELRKRGYVPIVFNFDKPETKDFTETVRLLAGLSKFVIADITNPKSSPLELQATVPEIMVPFQPIIERGEKPFAMLKDLQRKHDWVFKTLRYSSLDRLIETMDDEIIKPAEAKFKQLLGRRAEESEDREV
jgi:uncharacterized protein YjbI with pentapeptide repeats